jgi:hypothetical protein
VISADQASATSLLVFTMLSNPEPWPVDKNRLSNAVIDDDSYFSGSAIAETANK